MISNYKCKQVDRYNTHLRIGIMITEMARNPPGSRGWEQTNFVELWSVFRPRLAEMAIEIWVMCQLTEKLFETSSV